MIFMRTQGQEMKINLFVGISNDSPTPESPRLPKIQSERCFSTVAPNMRRTKMFYHKPSWLQGKLDLLNTFPMSKNPFEASFMP